MREETQESKIISVGTDVLIELFTLADNVLAELIDAQTYIFFFNRDYGEDFANEAKRLLEDGKQLELCAGKVFGEINGFKSLALKSFETAVGREKHFLEKLIEKGTCAVSEMSEECRNAAENLFLKEDRENLENLAVATAYATSDFDGSFEEWKRRKG